MKLQKNTKKAIGSLVKSDDGLKYDLKYKVERSKFALRGKKVAVRRWRYSIHEDDPHIPWQGQ